MSPHSQFPVCFLVFGIQVPSSIDTRRTPGCEQYNVTWYAVCLCGMPPAGWQAFSMNKADSASSVVYKCWNKAYFRLSTLKANGNGNYSNNLLGLELSSSIPSLWSMLMSSSVSSRVTRSSWWPRKWETGRGRHLHREERERERYLVSRAGFKWF